MQSKHFIGDLSWIMGESRELLDFEKKSWKSNCIVLPNLLYGNVVRGMEIFKKYSANIFGRGRERRREDDRAYLSSKDQDIMLTGVIYEFFF